MGESEKPSQNLKRGLQGMHMALACLREAPIDRLFTAGAQRYSVEYTFSFVGNLFPRVAEYLVLRNTLTVEHLKISTQADIFMLL